MEGTPLERQRAALQALVVVFESLDQDVSTISNEFKTAAEQTYRWIERLEKEDSAVKTMSEPSNTSVVLLASSSKWRRALVSRILPDSFTMAAEAISPDIDEKAIRRDNPEDMVKAIANAKMDKALTMLQDRDDVDFVICADQVIVHAGQVREKPLNEAQAKEHLLSYGVSGLPAECVSGVVVASVSSGVRVQGTDRANQFFSKVPSTVADALIAKGDIMWCAGSFVVEDPLLEPYLDKREGELESIQGMPRELTRRLLLDCKTQAQQASKRARLGPN